MHDLEGGKILKKTIDGFGGKWIRGGKKGKPIRMNLTCHDASNIAHNWQLIPSNLDQSIFFSVFSASAQSSITITWPLHEWGQKSRSLLADSGRAEASPACEASLWEVRGRWQAFLTVSLLSGCILLMQIVSSSGEHRGNKHGCPSSPYAHYKNMLLSILVKIYWLLHSQRLVVIWTTPCSSLKNVPVL